MIAGLGFGAARIARSHAQDIGPDDRLSEAPFAPTPGAAPFVCLGYRELCADLLFVRLLGYFGGPDNEAHAMASLAEAIATLDPAFRRPYEIGAVAITGAKRGVDNESRLRAIALLAQASREFPTYWKYPHLAGAIYIADLQTNDPAQRRDWEEKGAMLLETAIRKPNAPTDSVIPVAILRSRYGQKQRAVDGLKEMLLITTDDGARARIIDQIAALEGQDADEIAAELLGARKEFDAERLAGRPALTPSMYLLVGPKRTPGFDLTDLATGGRDWIGAEGFEHLEPLTDPPATR